MAITAEFAFSPPKSREEAEATLKAQREAGTAAARAASRATGVVDLFAGVPWLMTQEYSQQALDSLLAQQERLDPKEYDRLRRLRMTSQGLLGDEKSRKKAKKRISVSEAKTYDEAINRALDKIFPYAEPSQKAQLVEDIFLYTALGAELPFLLQAVAQAAPKGIKAVRDALKNMGKNVDEADQAVMKAEMETGMSETPLLPKPEMPWGDELYRMENEIAQLENLETRMYDLKNLLRQEGQLMSKANLDKLMREIAKVDYEIRKLTMAGAATAITAPGEAKSPGAEEVQNSVDYALKQWM